MRFANRSASFRILTMFAAASFIYSPTTTAQTPNASSAIKDAVSSPAISPTQSSALNSGVRLGKGDLVEISVFNVPELNTKARVNDEGNVNLPLINDVHLQGLTINEADEAIEQRLDHGGFVRNPHVQILVSESVSEGASLLGEVAHPGVYPILGEQTLFRVISAAGGLTDRAGTIITVSHRAAPDRPVKLEISRNLEDHPNSNISIVPGDTIMVRRADVVYVVGDVSRPSGLLMDNGGHLTVLQALALAGGTTSTAKLSGARIIRKGPDGVTEVPVSLKKLLQAKTSDVPLQADDILFVPSSVRKVIGGRTTEAALQLATAASLIAIHP